MFFIYKCVLKFDSCKIDAVPIITKKLEKNLE